MPSDPPSDPPSDLSDTEPGRQRRHKDLDVPPTNTPVSAMDPLALALQDHVQLNRSVDVDFRRDDGIWYAQSTDQYFTVPQWLVEIEENILSRTQAPVLDVGAASGRHALMLQQRQIQVTAIDSCQKCVELMQSRGVLDAREVDIFDLDEGAWHTVLFMMETIGLVGTIDLLRTLLVHLHRIVRADGQILLDARAVQSDGGSGHYEGELELQMRYRDTIGEVFRWLYVDFDTLCEVASDCGWTVEQIGRDEQTEAYAARLSR